MAHNAVGVPDGATGTSYDIGIRPSTRREVAPTDEELVPVVGLALKSAKPKFEHGSEPSQSPPSSRRGANASPLERRQVFRQGDLAGLLTQSDKGPRLSPSTERKRLGLTRKLMPTEMPLNHQPGEFGDCRLLGTGEDGNPVYLGEGETKKLADAAALRASQTPEPSTPLKPGFYLTPNGEVWVLPDVVDDEPSPILKHDDAAMEVPELQLNGEGISSATQVEIEPETRVQSAPTTKRVAFNLGANKCHFYEHAKTDIKKERSFSAPVARKFMNAQPPGAATTKSSSKFERASSHSPRKEGSVAVADQNCTFSPKLSKRPAPPSKLVVKTVDYHGVKAECRPFYLRITGKTLDTDLKGNSKVGRVFLSFLTKCDSVNKDFNVDRTDYSSSLLKLTTLVDEYEAYFSAQVSKSSSPVTDSDLTEFSILCKTFSTALKDSMFSINIKKEETSLDEFLELERQQNLAYPS